MNGERQRHHRYDVNVEISHNLNKDIHIKMFSYVALLEFVILPKSQREVIKY